MSIATLKRTPEQKPDAGMRSTEAQDRQIEQPRGWRHDRRVRIGAVAVLGLVALIAIVALLKGWATTQATVSVDRVRLGTVTRGEFLSDVAAQATVVAAVSPTLYAPAVSTGTLKINAGDTVKKGDLLATVESPGLKNEFERERATLESLVVDLRRQEIDLPPKMRTSQATAKVDGVPNCGGQH